MKRIREWFRRRRKAKCDREGHFYRVESRRAHVVPSESYRGVADRIREERLVCVRCSHVEEDWHETYRTTIHSLTLPGRQMEQLEYTGRLELR